MKNLLHILTMIIHPADTIQTDKNILNLSKNYSQTASATRLSVNELRLGAAGQP